MSIFLIRFPCSFHNGLPRLLAIKPEITVSTDGLRTAGFVVTTQPMPRVRHGAAGS